MVRDNRVSLGFDEDEIKELNERAKETHLKVGDYIRWYLFKPIEAPQRIIQSSGIQHQVSIPYKAAPEVIERIKAGSPVYVDPYEAAKLEAQATFSESGGVGELHNKLIIAAKGGSVLKKIPKKDIKAIAKQKEERKHIANKHIPELKQKNIAAGYLDDKEPIILEVKKDAN